MTFRITKPGFYRTRDGRKEEVFAVLPERAGAKFPVIGLEGKTWGEYGFRHEAQLTDKDLVAEWVESHSIFLWVTANGFIETAEPQIPATKHKITLRDGKIVDVTDEA